MAKKKLLVITASNGENLKLAERFVNVGKNLNYSCELLDLTESKNDLPIFNPRHNLKDSAPTNLQSINTQMDNHTHWVICAPEYNGSIPPILTNAIAWLSVQGKDFRSLFNERPIAITSFCESMCMMLSVSAGLSFLSISCKDEIEKLIATVNEEVQVADAWLTRKYVSH